MNISMAGTDYKTAPIGLREKIAFTETETVNITKCVFGMDGVTGCVILSTCNRTELYISSNRRMSAAKLFFKVCGAEYGYLKDCMKELYDTDAAEHIAEVACGLHSAILCEEQITSQVGAAVRLSRSIGCSSPELNTLFRLAVTAGKKALTDFSAAGIHISAAQAAADKAETLYGSLRNKKALVIGNGKMGILAARALIEKGCGTDITLRRYKHGDNIVPDGAGTIEFRERRSVFSRYDFIITATRSPHYTVDINTIASLENRPDYVFDLAVPRDTEPGVERYLKCFTIDDIETTADRSVTEGVKAIAHEQAREFIRWAQYKEGNSFK